MCRSKRILAVNLIFLFAAIAFHPSAKATNRHMRKYQPPPPMGQVVVTVLRASDDKPVHNAAVVFHTRQDGKDDGNMELKTNEDGKATLTIIPIGSKVMVQVIAPGFRTFGKEYDVPASTNSITVKLLRPNQQYSLYNKKSNSEKSDLQTNTPQTQMGSAAPADSPLLDTPDKKSGDH